jgi:hypothetical protein
MYATLSSPPELSINGDKVRKILIIVFIIACILGYGYWHSSTHASFHIQLNFKDVTIGKPKTIPSAEIIFLDSKGRVLANGISDEQYNYVHLIHPEVGDCHEVEKLASSSKEAKESWQECFEHLSTWIPKWAGEVRQVDLKTQNCLLKKIPVTVSKNNSDWFLWWVPHPHIGGKPYSYYNLSIPVEKNNCEN